ncbi:MAG TPA: TIGR04290 family methyltransferase, partial [Candidatus Binatia bacterium]|nr:TIGR04290 family methyltransferase [Candidatus Binatia bacterium]
SMQRGSNEVAHWDNDYHFWQQDMFEDPAFPRMSFIEKKYCGDPTNWWVPNRACSEAMLRSAGFKILVHPEEEVFICRWQRIEDCHAVYPEKAWAPASPS